MGNIFKISLIFSFIVLIAGCATTPPGNQITNIDIYHDSNKETGIQELSLPPLGIKTTKNIGESLYEQFRQFEYDTYTVVLEGDTEAKLHNTKLSTNGDRSNHTLYAWSDKKLKAFCVGDVVIGFASIEKRNACLLDSDNDGFFDSAAYGNNDHLYPLQNTVKYILIPKPPTFGQDGFRYVVYYQGKVANSIKLSFREFIDNYARPAFTQDIQYELNAEGDTEIGFKALRILVHGASNTSITYTVINSYK